MSPNNHDDHDSDINVRPMRRTIKVLYTFDEQSKTNCLARWPHILDVQTVSLDERTAIGVIDLKTCVQAIVQCSPELVASLGQDFTVYAFDFSEDDTPLVGQGMLSWALAAPGTDVESASRQLITGRVTKNILGLFNNGVKETLEVKLRLVPVPSVQQGVFLNSLERYRELSKVIPSNFDLKEWSAFLESNPEIASTGQKSTPVPQLQRKGSSLEAINQLLSPTMQPHDLADPFNTVESRNSLSRPVSPSNISRPSSRASQKRGRKPRTKSVNNGDTSGYEEGTDGEEQPIARKRAKVMQTDWKSKSSFGSTSASESLRVAASTAGSIRNFRPIAPAATGTGASHLQEVPRAPTPVPFGQNRPQQENVRRSSLFQSTFAPPKRYRSPYAARDPTEEASENVRMSIESAMTSPERPASPADTPMDIGSSPPVIKTLNSVPSSPGAAPSSPVLPEMPRVDSGFFSGSIEDCSLNDLFEDDDFVLPAPRNEVGTPQSQMEDDSNARKENVVRRPLMPARLQSGTIIEVTPGPPELLPKTILPRAGPQPKQRADSRPKSKQTNKNILPSEFPIPHSEMDLPMMGELQPQPQSMPQPAPRARKNRTASVSTMSYPQMAASEPSFPPCGLPRSHTWSDAMHPQTDAPDPNAPGFTRTTAGKKQAIRQKLEDAIARGEMPPYCSNCGAIETPTWRKAWAQEIRGAPGYHEYSDEPGRVTAIDILERNDEGEPTLYRIIKKSLASTESKEDFIQFLLCNPCGIWMSKYNRRRPEDKWDKEPGLAGEPKKRARSNKPKNIQPKPNLAPASEAYLPSDAPAPATRDSPPIETLLASQLQAAAQTRNEPEIHAPAPLRKQRSSSVRPVRDAAAAKQKAMSVVTRREVQSSPVRWAGSEHSPIDVDDDLGSTRRLLFPSPRKAGELKVLGPVAANTTQPATEFRSPKAASNASNKENAAPVEEEVDREILQLFEEEIARPTTPVRNSPPTNGFKTPTHVAPKTPSHRPLTRSQSRSIRSSAQKILMMVQRTPSKTPSKTPGSVARRRSPRNHPGSASSPFSMALNQMLSRTNGPESPSRMLGLELDFSALPPLDHSMGFNFPFDNEDFFSTDVPMPSSPPRLLGFNDDGSHMDISQLWGSVDLGVHGGLDLSHALGTDVFKTTDLSNMSPPKKIVQGASLGESSKGKETTS